MFLGSKKMVAFKKIGFIVLFFISVFVIESASSHGWSEYPKARQAICSDQGGLWSGSPPNEACAQAKIESGTYPFVQKNEFSTIVLNFNNAEEVEAAVPKGTLCYANDPAKSGMGITSPHWTRTEMTSGSFEFVFNATAPHNPSFWKIYLTKPDFVITNEFGWENLNLIADYGNIPVENGKYKMQVTLPEGQSGDAILLVRWQRDDAAGEGFYNCSDITLVDKIGGAVRDEEEEEPTLSEPYLIEGDQYIPASFDLEVVQAEDTLRFTVNNEFGALHSQFSVLVTKENIDYWPKLLASEVNGYYADTLSSESKVFIGAWHEEMGHYMYFKDNLSANFFNAKTAGFSGELTLLKSNEEESNSVGLMIIPKVLIGLQPTEVTFGEKLYLEIDQVATKLDTVIWIQTSGPTVETFEDGSTLVVNTNSLLETDIPAELIFAVSGALDEVIYKGVIAVSVADGEAKSSVPESGSEDPESEEQGPETEDSEYVPGTAYQVGQRITHFGNLYICLVSGWCSNAAANWAYEPGVGIYWTQAWMSVSESNDEPNPNGAAGCDDWQSSKVYWKDDTAIYNQIQWKAKWWTSGEEPGSIGSWGAWQKLGPYNCPF
jgi:predicted carbohydrate-binding protein with CBM5 and CBM33 domain